MSAPAPTPSERCREIFAALSEYLDMTLAVESCEELEAHLEGCPPCIEFVESLRRTVALCRSYSASERPGALREEARRELADAYRAMLAARAATADRSPAEPHS